MPLLNEILVPLVKHTTSVDRSYPSGSLSRQTVACKLSDVLYIIAQRIGVELLRQHLTEPLQLFFSVFTVTLSSTQPLTSEDVLKSDTECQKTGANHKGMRSHPIMPDSKNLAGYSNTGRPVNEFLLVFFSIQIHYSCAKRCFLMFYAKCSHIPLGLCL